MRNMMAKAQNFILRKEAQVLNAVYAQGCRKKGNAIVAEVIVMVVLIALAVAYKTGALKYVGELWTQITTNSTGLFN